MQLGWCGYGISLESADEIYMVILYLSSYRFLPVQEHELDFNEPITMRM